MSSATSPSSPWAIGPNNGFISSPSSEWNHNGDSYSYTTSTSNTAFSYNNKLSSDSIDNDTHLQVLPDDLQATSKDGKNYFD